MLTDGGDIVMVVVAVGGSVYGYLSIFQMTVSICSLSPYTS